MRNKNEELECEFIRWEFSSVDFAQVIQRTWDVVIGNDHKGIEKGVFIVYIEKIIDRKIE